MGRWRGMTSAFQDHALFASIDEPQDAVRPAWSEATRNSARQWFRAVKR